MADIIKIARDVISGNNIPLPEILDQLADFADGSNKDILGPISTVYRILNLLNLPQAQMQGMIDFATGKDITLSADGKAGTQQFIDTLASFAGNAVSASIGIPFLNAAIVFGIHQIKELPEATARLIGGITSGKIIDDISKIDAEEVLVDALLFITNPIDNFGRITSKLFPPSQTKQITALNNNTLEAGKSDNQRST